MACPPASTTRPPLHPRRITRLALATAAAVAVVVAAAAAVVPGAAAQGTGPRPGWTRASGAFVGRDTGVASDGRIINGRDVTENDRVLGAG